MRLLDYLDPALIELHLPGTTKREILANLVSLLVAQGTVPSRADLLDSLLEREGLGSTGIGHGVAIPHGRCAVLEQPAIVFARSDAEVDFDSIDGLPTRIFFLLVAPDNGGNEHLHLLAKVARLMRDAATRAKLLDCERPEQVLELFGTQDPA
ncbi:MAG: PTS sugar transporter subunit IIA [Gammaproteobacteria bacterium]|nr:PTS sugar transporter subunit IIA [Gammaproteobacteria bacterium]NIR99349.1 PTS sugar transporter subunit IIA [Gammaproteobacteria bacterium]NIT64960.1 PTS sugar transporter subunit IIA [Gammaproteobacteria bacterium]NIV21995.1 PTS transporter subunit EIIA [Gammaproteobacteria bacterium]NIY33539.1 PTS transporter subunit EIIA [Gammaproteobacteria bacterium]